MSISPFHANNLQFQQNIQRKSELEISAKVTNFSKSPNPLKGHNAPNKEIGLIQNVSETDNTRQQRSVSVPDSAKLTNDQIIAELDKTLTQARKASIYELSPSDFMPEKVADRILSFIGAAFSDIGSENKATQLERIQQAREGIEKGFKEAKNILEDLNSFKGEVAENANKTYELLQNGMKKIESNINTNSNENSGSDSSVLDDVFNTGQNDRVEVNESVKQSFDFELSTSDGDKIRININKLNMSYDENSVHQFRNNDLISYESTNVSTKLSQSGYSISIKGHLDEKELVAVDQLLDQITNVSNLYFSGNAQAAFEKANELGYNSSEIADFSVNLIEAQQKSMIDSYQKVENLASNDMPSDFSVNDENQLLAPLKEYAYQLLDTYMQHGKMMFSDENKDNSRGSHFLKLMDNLANINNLADEKHIKGFDRLNSAILARFLEK